MFELLSDQNRFEDARITLGASKAILHPNNRSFRLEFAREWGACVLGIDQAIRGPLSAMGPVVFCGAILPCLHETDLESQGVWSCPANTLSGSDQERLTQIVQSDSYIAWILRVISSEAADGARCSMGVLEHTTTASIIKEALAAGIDIRGIRVSATCDTDRFRQFLYEAFPMIDDIVVYPKSSATSTTAATTTTTTITPSCQNSQPNLGSLQYLLPPSPQSLPSSPLNVSSSYSGIPPIIGVAGVMAQSTRDSLSRQLLYRQRLSPSPLSRSPLSKPMHALRKRDHLTQSASSFFNGPLFRSRSCSEEDAHRTNPRCAAFAGSEFGEAHCGLVSEVPPPSLRQSETVPIDMYDFCDDDSGMMGITSPKRIRVVPCSPPLPNVFSCEDSLPCVVPAASNSHSVSHSTGPQSVDSFESSPYPSTSLFVSPPPFASCSSASTSVPMFRSPMYGLTSPF